VVYFSVLKYPLTSLFAGSPCMHDHILKCDFIISYKQLVQISPDLQLWCIWGQMWTDEIWGHKVKGQWHSETKYGQVSTLVGIFSPVSGMRGHILMRHLNYSLLVTHDTDNIFKVTGSEVKVTDNIFRKCTFLAEAYPAKDHLVCFWLQVC